MKKLTVWLLTAALLAATLSGSVINVAAASSRTEGKTKEEILR